MGANRGPIFDVPKLPEEQDDGLLPPPPTRPLFDLRKEHQETHYQLKTSLNFTAQDANPVSFHSRVHRLRWRILLRLREKYAPTQPMDPGMKRDWISILCSEVQTRLELVVRFLMFLSEIEKGPRWWRRQQPIILFLREFRHIEYRATIGAHIATRFESDSMLRFKIEKRFPKYPVLWVANPK